MRDNQSGKKIPYIIGVYETREDAGDAFNYLVYHLYGEDVFDIDYEVETTRELSINHNGLHFHHRYEKQRATSFDKMCEIIWRHENDLAPRQKDVSASERLRIDSDLNYVLSMRSKLRDLRNNYGDMEGRSLNI